MGPNRCGHDGSPDRERAAPAEGVPGGARRRDQAFPNLTLHCAHSDILGNIFTVNIFCHFSIRHNLLRVRIIFARVIYIEVGIKLREIHRVLSFTQKGWLKRYIDPNTAKGTS